MLSIRGIRALFTFGCITWLSGCGSPFAQSCESLANTMQEEETNISRISNLVEVKRVFISTSQGEPLLVCKGDAATHSGEMIAFEVSYALTKSDASGREYTTAWEFK